jgi:hypothetical protein
MGSSAQGLVCTCMLASSSRPSNSSSRLGQQTRQQQPAGLHETRQQPLCATLTSSPRGSARLLALGPGPPNKAYQSNVRLMALGPGPPYNAHDQPPALSRPLQRQESQGTDHRKGVRPAPKPNACPLNRPFRNCKLYSATLYSAPTPLSAQQALPHLFHSPPAPLLLAYCRAPP